MVIICIVIGGGECVVAIKEGANVEALITIVVESGIINK